MSSHINVNQYFCKHFTKSGATKQDIPKTLEASVKGNISWQPPGRST